MRKGQGRRLWSEGGSKGQIPENQSAKCLRQIATGPLVKRGNVRLVIGKLSRPRATIQNKTKANVKNKVVQDQNREI